MVREVKCECDKRFETDIHTQIEFLSIRSFFENELEKNVFYEIKPELPYYTWKQGAIEKQWYATKWYKCRICGCLWEFQHPDFPAKGFVRKFPSGLYIERGF